MPQSELSQLEIYIDGTAGLNGYITGTVDPTIEIDPSWQYAADYTIETSSIPQSTVPEPSCSCLLGTGLLALLGARKYKKLHANPGGAANLNTETVVSPAAGPAAKRTQQQKYQ